MNITPKLAGIIALRQLKEFSLDLIETNKYHIYLINITKVLKIYLENSYQINISIMTLEEINKDLGKNLLGFESKNLLYDILNEIELAHGTDVSNTQETLQNLSDKIKKFIEITSTVESEKLLNEILWDLGVNFTTVWNAERTEIIEVNYKNIIYETSNHEREKRQNSDELHVLYQAYKNKKLSHLKDFGYGSGPFSRYHANQEPIDIDWDRIRFMGNQLSKVVTYYFIAYLLLIFLMLTIDFDYAMMVTFFAIFIWHTCKYLVYMIYTDMKHVITHERSYMTGGFFEKRSMVTETEHINNGDKEIDDLVKDYILSRQIGQFFLLASFLVMIMYFIKN